MIDGVNLGFLITGCKIHTCKIKTPCSNGSGGEQVLLASSNVEGQPETESDVPTRIVNAETRILFT